MSESVLRDKICVVTGANSGIGYAVTKGLLLKGAKVIMACRNWERAQAAQSNLMKETKNPNIIIIICDLSLQKSISDFVAQLAKLNQKIDLLCQCAGHISFKRQLTNEGIESNFATNVLGPHLLAKLLIPHFHRDRPGQIINIAGEFHRFFKLNFKDLFYEKKFSLLRVGSVSMLERITLTYSLAAQLKNTNITVNCFHPGNIKTEMTAKFPLPLKILAVIIRPFQSPPEIGSDTCLWLAEQTFHGNINTGKYFINRKEVESARQSLDQNVQNKLNQACEELIGKY